MANWTVLLLLAIGLAAVHSEETVGDKVDSTLDSAGNALKDAGDAIGGAAESAWAATKGATLKAKDFLAQLPDKAAEDFNTAKMYITEKAQTSADLAKAESKEQATKVLTMVESYLQGVKDKKAEFEKDATEAQKKALADLDAKLQKVRDAKAEIAKDSTTKEQAQAKLTEVSDDLYKDDFMTNVNQVAKAALPLSPVTGLLFTTVGALLIRY